MSVFKSAIKQKSLPTLLLAASMFFTGASGLIIQNILIVTASNILGNTFEQLTITIALMLGFMGFGGTFQKYVKKNLISSFVGIEILLAILTGFAPIALYATYSLMPDHFVIVQYFWISITGFLIGMEIPIISRINEKYQPDIKDNLASVVTMDYIGSMVGGFAWIWLFLGKTDLSTAAFITASLNLFVAVVTFSYFAKKENKPSVIKTTCAIFATVGLIVFGFLNSSRWEVYLHQNLYEDRVVLHKRTQYQDLTVTYNPKIDDYRLFINGNLQFSTTDEKIYHELLVHPVMSVAKSRKNVLVLGGGDGMAVREVLKYDDVESVTLVDLDREMIDMFRDNPVLSKLNNGSFKNAKVRTLHPKMEVRGQRSIKVMNDDGKTYERVGYVDVFILDAFSYVKDFNDKLYDVVIIDFPDPSLTELSKLYSKEFYTHLHGVLAPDATLSIQSTSPFHAKEAFLCIGRTFESAGYKALPYHQNVPSFGDWGWYLVWNDSRSKTDVENDVNNIKSFDVPVNYINSGVLSSSLSFGNNYLNSKEEGINTLLNPVLLNYYLKESWKIE